MRDKGLDRLRIFAAYLIVLLHLSVNYISKFDLNSVSWWISDALSAASRIGVPIFVMITGAFLLDEKKEITVRIIVKKYIFKAALIFSVTSVFYAAVYYLGVTGETVPFSKREFLKSIVIGHYHLWYLYMIAGLYLLTPIFRSFVKNAEKGEVLFFIAVSATFNFVFVLNRYVFHFIFFHEIGEKMAISTLIGYAGYYVAGWYLSHIDLKGKIVAGIYTAAVLSYVIAILGTGYISAKQNTLNIVLYTNYSLTIFCMSTAIFLFFKRSDRINKSIFKIERLKLYKVMFIVYLIHPFFIERFRRVYDLNLFLASIVIFLVSTVAAIILKGIADFIVGLKRKAGEVYLKQDITK